MLFSTVAVVQAFSPHWIIGVACALIVIIMYWYSEKDNNSLKSELSNSKKEQDITNEYLETKQNYPDHVLFLPLDIPQWLVILSEKHCDWEIRFKNCFDVKKGKELLNLYYSTLEKTYSNYEPYRNNPEIPD